MKTSQVMTAFTTQCGQAAREWWHTHCLITLLGDERDAVREAAIAALVAQGEGAVPRLRRALHGPVGCACGAAVALLRLGQPEGVQVVLGRCYEEEWLVRCVSSGHVEGLRALRWLGREQIGHALETALDGAARERHLQACLAHLTVAVSALRVLLVFRGTVPRPWLERALRYGHRSLSRLGQNPSRVLAFHMTDRIRRNAVRCLTDQHLAASYETLLSALESPDLSVAATALQGLRWLGDRRALPHLQAIAFATGWTAHPLASQARAAIAQIAGAHADALILLRASASRPAPDELLRPILTGPEEREPQTLLRPPAEGPADGAKNAFFDDSP